MLALIKNKECKIKSSHSNNSGIITVFIYFKKGNTKTTSFNISKYKTVELFIIKSLNGKILSND